MRVELRLEVEVTGEPIRGVLHDGRGGTHDFQGWLQLMAAVDSARSQQVETAAQVDIEETG